MTLAAAGAAAAEETPAAFLASWQRAAERPEEAADQWRGFAEAHRDHDLGRLAMLLLGIDLLRDDTNAAQLDQALACFRFELPGADAAAPKKRTPRRNPGRVLGQGRLPARLRPPDTPAEMLRNTPGSAAANEADQAGDGPVLSPFRKHLSEAGKGWTARVGMVRLGRHLRAYYRRHVQYPTTLDELVQSGAGGVTPADLVDPFEQRFEYQAMARKLMPKVPRQAFGLRCTTTGATGRQLQQVLRDAFEPPRQVAISTLTPQSQRVFVRHRRKDGSFGPVQNWPVGETQNGLTLWAINDGFIIIGQHDRPRLVAASLDEPEQARAPLRERRQRNRNRQPTFGGPEPRRRRSAP